MTGQDLELTADVNAVGGSVHAAQEILAQLGPRCRDHARRQLILDLRAVNGIDFVEFEVVSDKPVLHVHFLLDLPAGAYGLVANPSLIRVHGGARIVDITVAGPPAPGSPAPTRLLDVTVDRQGDFSPYLLSFGWSQVDSGAWIFDLPGIDRLFSVAPVNFRPECPVDFDCLEDTTCDKEELVEPALDYLARDYASFRQLLLDLVAQRNPRWVERNPADLGVALLELFAYEGDHLSYLQDAVANEMYLDTARRRSSAKRHATLVDYAMHDGRNAWTYVHFSVTTAGSVPAHVQLVTRITEPLAFDRDPASLTGPLQPSAPPPVELHQISGVTAGVWFDDVLTDPALRGVRVFETIDPVMVDAANNELRIHAWGNTRCCLPAGATTAHMFAVDPVTHKAVRPPLGKGDLLLLEEVLGPATGAAADADPKHRTVVRVERVEPDPFTTSSGSQSDRMRDPLYMATLDAADELQQATGPLPVDEQLPLVEVTWVKEDALRFPLTLSEVLAGTTALPLSHVSVARGNVTVADHGRRIDERVAVGGLGLGDAPRLRLRQGPVTMTALPGHRDGPVVETVPAVELSVLHSHGPAETWDAVRDLLDSGQFDPTFVVDVELASRAELRFGDGDYGRRLLDVTEYTATYRIGNGVDGNIGAEGLAHVVRPWPLPVGWPTFTAVRNPLPAGGGAEPQTIEEVRHAAPAAFRTGQLRAVTEEDYRQAALTVAGVQDAAARFRWTGSWYTVFVGIDPADDADLLVDPRGRSQISSALHLRVLKTLERYRLAGYDLQVRGAQYVPLDLVVRVCARPGYFRGDVAHAVRVALTGASTRRPGFFANAHFTFGQPVFLSQVYATVEAVPGVDSAQVITFQRHGRLPSGELEQGFLGIGPWEIAQLADDPSRPEQGTATITVGGGS